jgi:Cu/Ag efflux protein CusF
MSKHILKGFDFRSESVSIFHWHIDALRMPALQKAYKHNDRPALNGTAGVTFLMMLMPLSHPYRGN